MENSIQSIPLEKLVFHPDNPNKMSKTTFAKLVRNIESSGRYEPLIVRPHPKADGCFEIINGHHRCEALAKLGYERGDCVVWEISDEETDVLLLTLNRLGGSDDLSKKLAVLKRLNKRIKVANLAKLLPQTTKQIERLTKTKPLVVPKQANGFFVKPMVFFLTNTQHQIVEGAMALVAEPKTKMTKAAKRTAALVIISKHYMEVSK